jgi:hypothetical protein
MSLLSLVQYARASERHSAAQLKVVTLPKLRRSVGKVKEPEAHALLETSAEVVIGLIKALDH